MSKNLFKLPSKIIKRYRAISAIRRLKSHESSIVRAIGLALHESLTDTNSDIEQKLIAMIEQRRSFLLNSTKEISVIDYGAGSHDSNRSKEEMDLGVESTAELANICRASKPAFWAVILFNIIRKIEPLTCIEFGTCVGISAAYQATALKMNGKGTLVTLEGSPEIAKVAIETIDNLNLKNVSVITGPFYNTLKSALESNKPIDFLFNDGHHDHDAVLNYFNDSIPFLSDTAVIVFDDISWSTGMRKAWTEIENDKRVDVSIDLRKMGIALICKDLNIKEKYTIPLSKNNSFKQSI